MRRPIYSPVRLTHRLTTLRRTELSCSPLPLELLRHPPRRIAVTARSRSCLTRALVTPNIPAIRLSVIGSPPSSPESKISAADPPRQRLQRPHEPRPPGLRPCSVPCNGTASRVAY